MGLPRIVSICSLQVHARLSNKMPNNGVTNSETEMCMWNYGVLLRVIGNCFP